MSRISDNVCVEDVAKERAVIETDEVTDSYCGGTLNSKKMSVRNGSARVGKRILHTNTIQKFSNK
eukprot:3216172-Amphidinium_carterae.2